MTDSGSPQEPYDPPVSHAISYQTPGKTPHEQGGPVVRILEHMDNWAHVIVAAFFILMAATVIVHMGFIFLRQLPLIIPASPPLETQAMVKPTHAGGSTAEPGVAETTTDAPRHKTENAEDPFVRNSLELLSNILFAVILLELLRTIITYLQTHDIQAIMQEFLVVGIISSVRKILLVGAEASLVGSKNQMEFIQEASGVVINIVGILLLILGLVMLRRAYSSKTQI